MSDLSSLPLRCRLAPDLRRTALMHQRCTPDGVLRSPLSAREPGCRGTNRGRVRGPGGSARGGDFAHFDSCRRPLARFLNARSQLRSLSGSLSRPLRCGMCRSGNRGVHTADALMQSGSSPPFPRVRGLATPRRGLKIPSALEFTRLRMKALRSSTAAGWRSTPGCAGTRCARTTGRGLSSLPRRDNAPATGFTSLTPPPVHSCR